MNPTNILEPSPVCPIGPIVMQSACRLLNKRINVNYCEPLDLEEVCYAVSLWHLTLIHITSLRIFIGKTDAQAEVPILWPPDVKSQLLRKILMLGKIEGRRRRGWQRMGWLDDITDSMDMSFSKLQEVVKDREAWSTVVHGLSKSRTWLSDWITTTKLLNMNYATDRLCVQHF